ncbi:hypothetical protein TcWFU_003928 [Taenia crassiceps]|uniref:Uncharacterized protein n=1 Tax=Taenia crassiceps TaxID=6207 RepID=A0ABR4Q3E3_9CEST
MCSLVRAVHPRWREMSTDCFRLPHRDLSAQKPTSPLTATITVTVTVTVTTAQELSRLVSVGQALGLLRLLDTLQLLLMEYLPPTLDTELLLKVHRLLRIETPTCTT